MPGRCACFGAEMGSPSRLPKTGLAPVAAVDLAQKFALVIAASRLRNIHTLVTLSLVIGKFTNCFLLTVAPSGVAVFYFQ